MFKLFTCLLVELAIVVIISLFLSLIVWIFDYNFKETLKNIFVIVLVIDFAFWMKRTYTEYKKNKKD